MNSKLLMNKLKLKFKNSYDDSKCKIYKRKYAGIDYLIAEHKGYELERNLIYGETSAEIMQSFRIQQLENTTCEKKFITAYISPEPKDGARLTDKELKEISHDFMKGIGVNPEKQAYLAIVHTERNHKHIHLLINRIVGNKTAMKDNFIVLKAHDTVHKIAKERGLVSAREIMQNSREKARSQSKELKQKMFEAHSQVMKLKPQTISKYMEYMKSIGYEIKPTINRAGKLQGFRIKENKSEQEFKLSEVKRSISAEIQKSLKLDLAMSENTSKMFVAHSQVMKLKPQSIAKYADYMKTFDYEISITRNKVGRMVDVGIYQSETTLKTGMQDMKKGVGDMLRFGKRKSFKELKEEFLRNRSAEFSLDIEIRQIMATQIEELSKFSSGNELKTERTKGQEI